MPQPSRLSVFIAELRRRRVFRVAAFYGGIAFVIIQIIDGTFGLMGVPEWVGRVLVVLLLIGFPISMILAWVFDINPEGIVRTEGRSTGKPGTSNRMLIAVTILAIAFGIWGWMRGVEDDGTDRITSIAVIPFDNLGADEQAFFADGLTDDLITELSRVSDLRVISRTSSMRYKGSGKSLQDIAAELNVGAILEGSVRRSGGQIRIVAQLIDTRLDDHIWSATYDIAEEMAAIFAMQTQLVKNIVNGLQSHLVDEVEAASAPTANLEAYDALLQGHAQRWHNFGREGLLFAVEHYSAATRADPSYSQAWAYLSVAHVTLYWRGYPWNDGTPKQLALATAALKRAISLDKNDPITLYAKGLYAYYGLEDWPAAEKEISKALLFRPDDPDLLTILAALRRRQGDFLTMIQYYQKAIELDPYRRSAYTGLFQGLHFLRDFDTMDRYAREALLLWPDRDTGYFWSYAATVLGSGDLATGHKILSDMKLALGDDGDNLGGWAGIFRFHTLLSGDTTGLGEASSYGSGGSLTSLLAEYWSGDAALYHKRADSTRAWLGRNYAANNLISPRNQMLEVILQAMDGDRTAAIEAGLTLVGEWPVEQDALEGSHVLYRWCLTQVIAGDLEGALTSAKKLLEIPSSLTRFELLNSVAFGPLRDHPGFNELVRGPGR